MNAVDTIEPTVESVEAKPAPASTDRSIQKRPPLGSRFLRIWFGQMVSTIGSTLSAVGVAVYVYLETGSEVWLGALAALAALPIVIVGPFLGLVDRFPRRSVMITADMLAAIGPSTALLLAVTGRLEVWHLVVAGFLGGLGTAVQTPASMAALPSLVEPEAIGRANGLAQLGPALGLVAGPVLATPLVAWWGIKAVLLADLATFLVGMLLTLLTPFADAIDDPEIADDRSWRAAWVWLRESGRPLLVLLVAMSAINFSLAFFNLALLVVATNVGGAARAGVALGAGGAAMIAGSLIVAHRGVSHQRIRTIVRTLVLVSAGTAVAASRPVFGLVVVGVALALVGVPAVSAAVATVFHERVPASMHGRVFGLRATISQTLGPIGAVIAGFVITNLAAPALEPNGVLSGTIGQLIGTGPDRGAALVMLCVAGALLALATGLWMARSFADLDEL
jgi:MFS family permease